MQPTFATRDRVQQALQQAELSFRFIVQLIEQEKDPTTKHYLLSTYLPPANELLSHLERDLHNETLFPNKKF